MKRIHCSNFLIVASALCAVDHLPASQAVLLGDATVQVALPTSNFGALPQLQVAPGSTALLRFSLATLPAGITAATVAKATVQLYVNRLIKPGSIQFAPTFDPWSEKSVTYANMPRLLSPLSGPIPIDAANGFVSFDVTPQLQSALRNGSPVLSGGIESLGAELFFDSKESVGASQPPRLAIQITGPYGLQGLPGPTGPQGPQGDAGDPGISTLVGRLSTFQLRDVSFSYNTGANSSLDCPADYPHLISGGCGFPFLYGSSAALSDMKVYYSGPSPNNSQSSWQCRGFNGSASTQTLRIYINCAK